MTASNCSAEEALSKFRRETTYAAVFPCTVCAQLHFQDDVVRAQSVNNLSTLAGLGRYCRDEVLEDWRFTCLGERWCCLSCKRSIDVDILPPMAARNNLGTPWAKPPLLLQSVVPRGSQLDNSALTGLATVERQFLQSWQPFMQVRSNIKCLLCWLHMVNLVKK